MNRKTAANVVLMLACMLAIALILTPTLAHATGKPEPVTPTPTSSTSSATSGSQAKAGASATSAVGDVTPVQTVGGQSMGGQSIGGDSVSSRAWSLFAQPPAFTPPMAPIAGCAPVITQEATSGWLIVGGASKASGKTDPTDCTLIALRNAKVDQCQYASAKQIEDLLTKKLLPAFNPSAVEFVDLAPAACAALKAPPKPEPEVRYVSAFPAPASAPVAAAAPACEKAPEPAKPAPKAAKVAKAAPKKGATCG